jgi:hypothetical protein
VVKEVLQLIIELPPTLYPPVADILPTTVKASLGVVVPIPTRLLVESTFSVGTKPGPTIILLLNCTSELKEGLVSLLNITSSPNSTLPLKLV